ncbi:uncharacterized protein TOT_030000797 [Theileria orientalis strain Shintoku]|uniref:DNA/RNA-binding protein Alba-like domain-containing protein n=1 Tax=Theileria orientalis strain Shintoku TaxID=869250 RepID=J4DPY9_THEOR|nr:uncharacterized protein TOT_030000797 [Theileria orientalis strain Shintoku]BAM41534.1 uncharacterized protein TOT_030000797 [Theileria orientalis strain Shintoku]|eukprot:XP_009691835.1 uncharacterized protein TOT_030000797 [Theileria orientalis strain Shintoku]
MADETQVEDAKPKDTRPPNSLIVSLSKNSHFYANVGIKLLNGSSDQLSYDEIFVTGLGTAIKVAIETAMHLSNRKVGVIKKIETSYYNSDTIKKHIPKINIVVAKC